MALELCDNQQFSEKTLKGYLLKNCNPNATDPSEKALNVFLTGRVDKFWDDVVNPLRKYHSFDGNKIAWYFEIYKEGMEARKLGNGCSNGSTGDDEQVQKIVAHLEKKTIMEYIELGKSFLCNAHMVLIAYKRDKQLLHRLRHIYASDSPVDWITTADREEKGLMNMVEDLTPVNNIIRNIGMLITRGL